jgi:hypothetical protein
MGERTWDDGFQGGGLEMSLIPLVSVFVAMRYEQYGWMVLALALTPWPFLIRSGSQCDVVKGRFRSFKGWKFAGRWVRWGRWREVQAGDAFKVKHVRHSMMNRRGAPRQAGIEYWDLICTRKGEEVVWHSYSNGQAAGAVQVDLVSMT